jgi:hypothetical protein
MAADLEKAREIVRKHSSFIGPGGTMPENIAKVVAEAIAAGRKEALERVAKIIEHELRSAGSSN